MMVVRPSLAEKLECACPSSSRLPAIITTGSARPSGRSLPPSWRASRQPSTASTTIISAPMRCSSTIGSVSATHGLTVPIGQTSGSLAIATKTANGISAAGHTHAAARAAALCPPTDCTSHASASRQTSTPDHACMNSE